MPPRTRCGYRRHTDSYKSDGRSSTPGAASHQKRHDRPVPSRWNASSGRLAARSRRSESPSKKCLRRSVSSEIADGARSDAAADSSVEQMKYNSSEHSKRRGLDGTEHDGSRAGTRRRLHSPSGATRCQQSRETAPNRNISDGQRTQRIDAGVRQGSVVTEWTANDYVSQQAKSTKGRVSHGRGPSSRPGVTRCPPEQSTKTANRRDRAGGRRLRINRDGTPGLSPVRERSNEQTRHAERGNIRYNSSSRPMATRPSSDWPRRESSQSLRSVRRTTATSARPSGSPER